MDPDEELVPLDDSVFENVLNDSLDVSSDAILDDSFSSVMASTPGRSRGQASPRRAGRPRGRGRGLVGGSSPTRSPPRTRSRSRSRSPAPPALPALPAPAALPRRLARAASPAPSVSSTASKPARLKCKECPSTFANERTFAVHKKMHALRRALARISVPQEFTENLPELFTMTLDRIIQDPCVGDLAIKVHDYSVSVKETFSALDECHDFLFTFAKDHILEILKDHKGVFSSSLSYTFLVSFNKLMSDADFRCDLKKHFIGLGDIAPPDTNVLNVFIGEFMHRLSSVLIVYSVKKVCGSGANEQIRRKRSGDKSDSRNFLELVYHIGGSVVHGFLFKGDKYKVNNKKWEVFVAVLRSKFNRSDDLGNACAESVRHFTETKDRGGLKHISQEALDFFVVLFDLLMSMEGPDGSLPVNVVEENVITDNALLCLWDILIGNELDEDTSLDFMMQMSNACKLIVMKGIMLRRLNDRLKKAYASVPLRSRLAE